MAGPILLILAIEAAGGTWVADFWLHVAVVDELARFPFNPPHPFVLGDFPSFYYTPYTLALGLIARLTALPAAVVLGVAGVGNLVLLLFALWLFVRRFSAAAWTPAIALVLVLLLWGPNTWQWSGFINLAGLPLILAYPSTFSTALMLLVWVQLMRTVREPTPGNLTAIGILLWLIALSHPYTMANTALGLIAILAWERSRWSWQLVIGLGVTAALAAGLTLAWPYFSTLDELRATVGVDAIHEPLYQRLVERVGLAAVGLPAIGWRWRRNRSDPLVLLFVLAGTVVVVGGLTGHPALGRAWPVVVLPLQLSAAIEVADRLPDARRVRTVIYGIAVAAAVLVGLRGGAGGLVRVLPSTLVPAEVRAELYIIEATRLPAVERCVTTDQVVATNNLRALRMLPGLGAKVIVPGYPDGYLPDEAARRRDQDALFNPTTAAGTVSRILAQYDVRWVLWDPTGPLADEGGYRTVATQPDGLRLLEPHGRDMSGDC